MEPVHRTSGDHPCLNEFASAAIVAATDLKPKCLTRMNAGRPAAKTDRPTLCIVPSASALTSAEVGIEGGQLQTEVAEYFESF